MALEGTESQEGSEGIEIVWSKEAFKLSLMANSSSVPSGSFYPLLVHCQMGRSQKSSSLQLVVEDRGPTVKPTWLLSPPLDCYVKTSSLLAYASEDLENEILSEVEVRLKVEYRGLCFKYTSSNSATYNPRSSEVHTLNYLMAVNGECDPFNRQNGFQILFHLSGSLQSIVANLRAHILTGFAWSVVFSKFVNPTPCTVEYTDKFIHIDRGPYARVRKEWCLNQVILKRTHEQAILVMVNAYGDITKPAPQPKVRVFLNEDRSYTTVRGARPPTSANTSPANQIMGDIAAVTPPLNVESGYTLL
ncbi:hypothetical protein PABG_05709 [Paracoccidioides brasiliensis Pb03]|nr:hypothetical protein PABG_05709 [Paracoccidioides brasiliensis Pb03]